MRRSALRSLMMLVTILLLPLLVLVAQETSSPPIDRQVGELGGIYVQAQEQSKSPSVQPFSLRSGVTIRLSGDWDHCGNRTCGKRSSAPRRAPVLHGCTHFRRSVRHPRDLLLAVHDSVHDHHRGRRGAAFESGLHVLGRGPLRLPAHARLHRGQLQRL